MDTSLLPPDFKEFLKLLNSTQVEYLLIGGYAVGYYGYSRATVDLDIWIAINPENAKKVAKTIFAFFGFKVEDNFAELFFHRDFDLSHLFSVNSVAKHLN